MDRTRTLSPSITYARVLGVALTLAGILGLVVNPEQDVVKSLLGLDINLTHNIVHLATGVLGLVAGFAALRYARTYAVVLGVVYTALAIWGFVVGEGFNPFGLLGNVNMADNFLHLAIGVLGLGAYVASEERDGEIA